MTDQILQFQHKLLGIWHEGRWIRLCACLEIKLEKRNCLFSTPDLLSLIDVRVNKIKVLWLPFLAVQIASMYVCLWCHLLAAGCRFMSSCHSLILLFTKTVSITIITYQTIWKTRHVMFKVHAQSLKVSTHIFVFMS